MYSLLLFVGLALVCRPLLFVFAQLRFSFYLVVGEEEDVFSLILHAPHVSTDTFSLFLLEMWDRYVI